MGQVEDQGLSRDHAHTASDGQGALPLPTSISDLSDGDLTLFWRLDHAEASLSFDESGHLETYVWNAAEGLRETYEGPYSLLAVKAFFRVLTDGVGRAPRPPQNASQVPGIDPNPTTTRDEGER